MSREPQKTQQIKASTVLNSASRPTSHFFGMPKTFQAIFLKLSPSFYPKHFTGKVTSKYATILHIFGTFSDMLQPRVWGLSNKKN